MSEMHDGAQASAAQGADHGDMPEMLQRIGHLTRMLRESMRELGLDKGVERAASAIPDARDRLNYIANMTEQAATRVLNAIDAARPVQDALESDAEALVNRWQSWMDRQLGDAEIRELVGQTNGFLRSVPQKTRDTNQQLMEILMAQDFQDLTGQVIKKVLDVVQLIESQLVSILLDNAPEHLRVEVAPTLLNGPQINPDHPDVVANQEQVDDLLESLGF
ncbi:protein phosphatase CheZ [Ralstonia mannitolilytica]|uniref:Protein phosphatase CheZ n=1 Tax=Ralstonia mannitolilytica TaxID=105219 RepID=A0AAD2ASS1_9RALS|nr:protein phosphatase CheZ [Ralstonia mannitolilytica]ANA35472.1 chemotaxis protein CheZ [Ralstonia mannitolilytica]MBY4716610.1 protein phosphatase CheZ [Ralstonia mannitolilytica]CAJ0687593.1 Protein phosphatase CheZ [Ralstonia mannitolilytica]CAJ0688272.1 Protein phosphatase CheZ [Ralstonia mannitolilytica]CAJ0689073.1 Protein phosphatase CheZ [Ralstonia mannitolilytica]